MTYNNYGPSPLDVILLAALGAGLVMIGQFLIDLITDRWRAWRTRHRDDPVEDATDDDAPAPLVGTWTPPRKWAANGRYVHRIFCQHMTRGELINVWSEDAARKWAAGASPRLTGCPHCTPFDTSDTATEAMSP